MDSLESDKDSWSEADEVTYLLRKPLDFNDCVIDLQEPFISENRILPAENIPLPREIWWIIAAHSGDKFHRIAQVSKEINGHIKCLVPHLVLPDYPSVVNILECLTVIESCEKAYKMLENCGLKAPSLPAYRSQVKKLTDAEIYVKYAPVFRWYDGVSRLQLLRGIHHLKAPKYPDDTLRIACSSFARDPLISSLSATAVVGLTLGGLYHFHTIRPEYLRHYQIAFNNVSSEEFPQSLIYDDGRRWANQPPMYSQLNINPLYHCYEKCQHWYPNELTEKFGGEIILPLDMCQNPNRTAPDYINLIHNFSRSINHVCGYSFRKFQQQLVNTDFWNFIPTISNYYTWGQTEPYPSIAKIRNHTAFIHVENYQASHIEDHDGPYCLMRTALYTYDPVCIANKMTYPFLITSAWGVTGGLLWMGFFIMMILGWCL